MPSTRIRASLAAAAVAWGIAWGGGMALATGRALASVVKVGPHALPVTVRQKLGRLSTTEAECVIPRSQAAVWRVLTDYARLDEMVPFLTESRVIGEEAGATILQQAGRGGVWVFQRHFTVVFRIEETPMRTIAFQAVRGDFNRFEGFWRVEARPEGTFVFHQVEVEPAFYVPRWAMQRIARHLMLRSLEGVITRCMDGPDPDRSPP